MRLKSLIPLIAIPPQNLWAVHADCGALLTDPGSFWIDDWAFSERKPSDLCQKYSKKTCWESNTWTISKYCSSSYLCLSWFINVNTAASLLIHYPFLSFIFYLPIKQVIFFQSHILLRSLSLLSIYHLPYSWPSLNIAIFISTSIHFKWLWTQCGLFRGWLHGTKRILVFFLFPIMIANGNYLLKPSSSYFDLVCLEVLSQSISLQNSWDFFLGLLTFVSQNNMKNLNAFHVEYKPALQICQGKIVTFTALVWTEDRWFHWEARKKNH